MNIGLFGIGGVYNYGCEAIVRGATKFLKDLYSDCSITYYTFNYQYDKELLKDLDIRVEKVVTNNNIFKRAINKLLNALDCNTRLLPFHIEQFKKEDLILSIGGDIYTIPAVERTKQKYKYYNSLVDFCDRIGKDIVVYGASVGPWGEYKAAVDYYTTAMKKYKLIVCRELESTQYLNKLGFQNVVFSPDPALLLGGKEMGSPKYIGINLSPLSLIETYGNSQQHDSISLLIDQLYDEFQLPIVFLPHVLSPDSNDNDLLFLSEIKNKMKHGDKVFIPDVRNGFYDVKYYAKRCYFVIAARMHCAINSIEENVPTIFVSYSQKSVGMCKYIYNSDEWLIGVKDINNQLIYKAKEILNKREKISCYLVNRNQEVFADYKESLTEIRKRLL